MRGRHAQGAAIVPLPSLPRDGARATRRSRRPSVAGVTEARQNLGRNAEELVAAHLRRQGMTVLERNARVRAIRGELDIVARDRAELVFVEVKAIREGNRYGPANPLEMVGPRKRAKLRSLAAAWIGERRPGAAGGVRFDVVGVTVRAEGPPARLEHIRGAF